MTRTFSNLSLIIRGIDLILICRVCVRMSCLRAQIVGWVGNRRPHSVAACGAVFAESDNGHCNRRLGFRCWHLENGRCFFGGYFGGYFPSNTNKTVSLDNLRLNRFCDSQSTLSISSSWPLVTAIYRMLRDTTVFPSPIYHTYFEKPHHFLHLNKQYSSLAPALFKF
jgi:hypothetical protein